MKKYFILTLSVLLILTGCSKTDKKQDNKLDEQQSAIQEIINKNTEQDSILANHEERITKLEADVKSINEKIIAIETERDELVENQIRPLQNKFDAMSRAVEAIQEKVNKLDDWYIDIAEDIRLLTEAKDVISTSITQQGYDYIEADNQIMTALANEVSTLLDLIENAKEEVVSEANSKDIVIYNAIEQDINTKCNELTTLIQTNYTVLDEKYLAAYNEADAKINALTSRVSALEEEQAYTVTYVDMFNELNTTLHTELVVKGGYANFYEYNNYDFDNYAYFETLAWKYDTNSIKSSAKKAMSSIPWLFEVYPVNKDITLYCDSTTVELGVINYNNVQVTLPTYVGAWGNYISAEYNIYTSGDDKSINIKAENALIIGLELGVCNYNIEYTTASLPMNKTAKAIVPAIYDINGEDISCPGSYIYEKLKWNAEFGAYKNDIGLWVWEGQEEISFSISEDSGFVVRTIIVKLWADINYTPTYTPSTSAIYG